MTKTRVDDMLIEMISPKIKEIEEKFSGNQPLTQDDINTLLLKSQYNHINHLDTKLNEVTQSVVVLETKFERRFAELETKFERRFAELETKFERRFAELETKFAGLETKFAGLETKFATLETKFEQANVKMQETIISTMKWYIGGAGVVLIVLKALDIFVK